MLILTHFIWTIPVVVIGFVYSYVLTQPDMIFNRWYRFMAAKSPSWMFYPLVHCEKCVCGQLALWLYPFVVLPMEGYDYSWAIIYMHIYFICQCILNVIILKAVYEKVIERPITPPKFKSFPQPLKPKENGKS